MKTDFEDLLLNRALEIRNNWNDLEKLKELIDAWDEEFDHKFDEILEKKLGAHLEEVWAKKARELGSNSLEDLLDILLDWPEAEPSREKIENGYKVVTKRCPVATSFLSIDRADYGPNFFCAYDPYICRGFNDRIKHRKTNSRMQGDETCIHFYTIDE